MDSPTTVDEEPLFDTSSLTRTIIAMSRRCHDRQLQSIWMLLSLLIDHAVLPKQKISGLESYKCKETKPDAESGASEHEEKTPEFTAGKNQYIGTSDEGMGDTMTVRVTVDDNKNIKNVEVLKQSESGIGADAIKTIPKEMVEKNTYDVDAVSGASATNRALKDAVKKAIEKAN